MHGPDAGGFWALVAVWWGMMAVMMLPVTWPWLRALGRLSSSSGGRAATLPAIVVPSFAAGYLVVWLAFSLCAAALQVLLLSQGSASPALRSGVLAVAGVYQFTPLKTACLEHCRSPLSVLLSRWPLGGPGALRLGVEHGLFCLGCCWALMLVALGAGALGWAWMAALTSLVAVEKLARPGPKVARWAGVALLGLALL